MAEGKHIEIASSHAGIGELRQRAIQGSQTTSGILTRPVGEREVARIDVPAHIGAVLTEGMLISHAWDPFAQKLVHGIQEYSVKDLRGRRAWMFENIGAFDKLEEPAVWNGALTYYLNDLRVAKGNVMRAENDRLGKGEIDSRIRETEEQLKAMMAVSAAARAIEKCAANPENYLFAIAPGKDGKVDKDAQDYLKTLILNKDPEKLYRVISDPLVNHYYQQVLRDAGLLGTLEGTEFKSTNEKDDDVGRANPEWHYKDMVDKKTGRTKRIWFPSRVAVATTEEIRSGRIKQIRDNGRLNPDRSKNPGHEENHYPLIYYLANGAEHGGFDAYIREQLLKRDTDEFIEKRTGKRQESDAVRWAAARLACDAFIADKATRWAFVLTSISEEGEIRTEKAVHGKNDLLMLSPVKNFGGDPLTNIIQPSFLPRQIKGVYEGEEASLILDMTDAGFRPDDIFFGDEIDYHGIKIDLRGLREKIMHPSAVTDLKKLARYNDAVGDFFGTSRARATSEYNMGMLKGSLEDIAENLDQINGDLTAPGKKDGKSVDVDIGKHVIGAQLARLLLAKAAAVRASMSRPTLLRDVFGPMVNPKSNQELREFREYLFGPVLDWKSGLIADFASRRTQYVIQDNMFGAERVIQAAFDVLAAPDESSFRKALKVGVVISTAFTQKR